MASTQFDPFAPFKEDEKLWYYRGLNTKPASLRKRKAQGYEIVSDEARHGDLVLGRIPRELKQAREQKNLAKAAGQKEAVASQFKEAAARQGIETFEEQ